MTLQKEWMKLFTWEYEFPDTWSKVLVFVREIFKQKINLKYHVRACTECIDHLHLSQLLPTISDSLTDF